MPTFRLTPLAFALGSVLTPSITLAQTFEASEEVPTIDVEPLRSEQAVDDAASSAMATDTIQITGTRIRRTDLESPQPLLVVNREDIERTGITTIGDILQRIPAAGSALNSTFNNGGTGATEIDLRNLGSNRVLVLVNGHRWVNGVSFANTASVDLNTIPVSIVERIEVLKDGASTIYGSDAIAGVVNVITRKDFVGTDIRAQVGAFEQGDGGVLGSSLSIGRVSSDDVSMFFDIGYVRQEPVFAGDREISRLPRFGTGLTRGSIFTPRGTLLFIPTPSNGAILGTERCPDLAPGVAGGLVGNSLPGPLGPGLGGVIGQAPNAPVGGLQLCNMILRRGETVMPGQTTAQVANRYQPFNRSTLDEDENDLYNFAPINYLRTPLEQTSLFAQTRMPVLDRVSATTQVLYNRRFSQQQLAETPLLFGALVPPPYNQAFISATNIFNPFDQDIGTYPGFGTDADAGLGPGFGILGRRFVEMGPRIQTQTVDTYFINTQVEGQSDLASLAFNWDFGVSYGRSQLNNLLANNLNMGRVARALGPDMNCTGALDGCVPLNLFGGPGTITEEMLRYVRADLADNAVASTQDYYANASTTLPVGDLLPRDLGLAFGLQYRRDKFRDTPDAITQANLSSGNNRRATAGQIDVREAYLELAVPILAKQPFAEVLDLSLAGRYSSYSVTDAVTTGKLGLEYRPYTDLMVRATASQGFRAPSVTELFLGGTDSFPQAADPCVGREAGSDVDQNCNAEGVPANVPQNSTQILTRFGGNPNLDPESSTSYTAGFVFRPQQVPGLAVLVDYFDIRVEDFIGTVGPQFILDQCYRRPAGSPRPASCDLVQRGGDGAVTSINAAFLNFARLDTRGVDIGFEYTLPFFEDYGKFVLQYDSQYLERYNQFTPTADGSEIRDRFAGQLVGDTPLPRYKANLRVNWALNRYEATWGLRYIGRLTEACTDGFTPRIAELGLCSNPDFDLSDGSDDSTNRIKPYLYHDVQFSYSLPGSLPARFVVGVNNLLNKQPPFSATAFANSFPRTLYEIPGRQPYLRMAVSF